MARRALAIAAIGLAALWAPAGAFRSGAWLAARVGAGSSLLRTPAGRHSAVMAAKKDTVPTVNKAELVSRIAVRSNCTKKIANDVLTAAMESIVESVCEGNKVMLVGFGSFQPKSLPAREGRNPRTGEKLQIQASRVPSFSVAKTFKERVNGSKDAPKA
mmetsp:Transcript_13546/g.45897  ORF Transcript_13546/g.45897 Transcript_13546/m.45897 type:complete len:159 (+) Transcript_13546:27-503(+)